MNSYGQGLRYVDDGSTGWIRSYHSDASVVTYMEQPAMISEPKTFAMLLTGLGLLGFMRFKKTAQGAV
jgi:hypothetical protein